MTALPPQRHPLQRLDSPSRGFSGALHVRLKLSINKQELTRAQVVGLISFYSSFKL
jgi:hypothetical protein